MRIEFRVLCFSWGYFLPRFLPLRRTLLLKQFMVNSKIIQRKISLYKRLCQTIGKVRIWIRGCFRQLDFSCAELYPGLCPAQCVRCILSHFIFSRWARNHGKKRNKENNEKETEENNEWWWGLWTGRGLLWFLKWNTFTERLNKIYLCCNTLLD